MCIGLLASLKYMYPYFVWLKKNISNFMANCTLWLKDTHLNWAMHQMQCRLTSSTVLSKWAINYVSSPSNRDHFCRYVCIDVSMVVGSLCSILLWNYYGCAVNRLDRKKSYPEVDCFIFGRFCRFSFIWIIFLQPFVIGCFQKQLNCIGEIFAYYIFSWSISSLHRKIGCFDFFWWHWRPPLRVKPNLFK